MEATIIPGAVAAPDTQALALMGGGAPVARAEFDGTGGFLPPVAKPVFEFLDISYSTGFGVEKGMRPGSLVFGREHVIADPKAPMTCVIMGAAPFWREWKVYDPNSKPREFANEAEAVKAGMRTARTPKGSGLPMPDCGPAVELALFVQEPAKPTTSLAFTLMFGGKRYAAARFKVCGTQYACIEKMLAQLPGMDAAMRGRPPVEGRLAAFFVTLTVDPQLDPTTKKVRTKLWLNPVLGPDNKPLRTDEAFWKDVRDYQDQLRAIQSAPAASGDEGPVDEPPIEI